MKDDDLNEDLSNWGNFFPDEDDLDEFDPNRRTMACGACTIMCLVALRIVAVMVGVVLS